MHCYNNNSRLNDNLKLDQPRSENGFSNIKRVKFGRSLLIVHSSVYNLPQVLPGDDDRLVNQPITSNSTNPLQ